MGNACSSQHQWPTTSGRLRARAVQVKAKAIQPYVDHMVTLAKDGSLHARRQVCEADPAPLSAVWGAGARLSQAGQLGVPTPREQWRRMTDSGSWRMARLGEGQHGDTETRAAPAVRRLDRGLWQLRSICG